MDSSVETIPVYSCAQVRDLDRIAIQEYHIPGYQLMTKAAQAAFSYIKRNYQPDITLHILCGTGNNAGDGYVLAQLALSENYSVQVIAIADPEKLSGDAQLAYSDFVAVGGEVKTLDQTNRVDSKVLIIDALLGTGLSRPVTSPYAEAIDWINKQYASTLALDVPSGLNADTGQPQDIAVQADATVTFIGMKQGLLTGQARSFCGEVTLEELEVPSEVYAEVATKCHVISSELLQKKLPPRPACAHKGHFGHSLLIGGNTGMSGAIRLAGEAALRSGSGLVTVGTDPTHAAWINQQRPELMIKALKDNRQLQQFVLGKSAIGIGPGLGQDNWALSLLLVALDTEIPLVIDADGLNLLSGINRRQNNWVLTPHPTEAARLLGVTTKEIELNRVQAVQNLQAEYGGVCVLKGAGTLIANVNKIAFCTAGNPGMASGGMGDVLTGIITAFLAQGMDLYSAACAGVQAHAMAADYAAEAGERGMLASDVIQQLIRVVNP